MIDIVLIGLMVNFVVIILNVFFVMFRLLKHALTDKESMILLVKLQNVKANPIRQFTKTQSVIIFLIPFAKVLEFFVNLQWEVSIRRKHNFNYMQYISYIYQGN